jgi:flagellar protein FlbD
MILLTQTDKGRTSFYLNHKDIKKITKTFQTVIYMKDSDKYIVLEEPEEIIRKIKKFEADIITIAYSKEEEK